MAQDKQNVLTQFADSPMNTSYILVFLLLNMILAVALTVMNSPSVQKTAAITGTNGQFLFACCFFFLWINFYYLIRFGFEWKRGAGIRFLAKINDICSGL